MNRMTALSIIVVFVLAIVFMGIYAGSSRAAGSPKQLREIRAKETEWIEKALPAEGKAKPEKPRKILVFWRCEGYFHESIPIVNKMLETMGKKTGAFEVVTSDDMSVFEANKLAEYDAIVFNNTTHLDFNEPSQRQAIMDFVKGGKGVIGFHAAIDNFYGWPEAAEMFGGTFDGHPWTAGGTWAIKNVEPEHPLNAAFNKEGFKIKDEIYRVKMLNLRGNSRVLLTLDFDDPATKKARGAKESDRDMPVSWIRNYDKGRVFYCGLGHNNEVFYRPAILQHCLDGIQFALGDLEVDATPVKEGK
ncbi:MAG: ThuA domain-containing protein [Sedimentisphaerales bacterium]|nr:ThuA domain-containing protein [Sedimentisphaerales bacterium]